MNDSGRNNLGFRRTFFGAIYMSVVICILAFGYNAVSPNSLSFIPVNFEKESPSAKTDNNCEPYPIFIDDAYEHFNSGKAIFIDSRLEEEFKTSHIQGAISLPVDKYPYRFRDLKGQLPIDGIYVIYCGGGSCDTAFEVARYLCSQGYKDGNIFVYEDGFELWVENQYPVEK